MEPGMKPGSLTPLLAVKELTGLGANRGLRLDTSVLLKVSSPELRRSIRRLRK